MQTFRKALPVILSLILATGMVAASELLHDKEIIFPEITAVAIGALAAPKQSWNASRLRLLLTITAAAVIGVGLAFVPLLTVIKIPLAILCAIACVTASKTEFLPAVSACVLPVLLGTKSPVYIGSVIVMTSLILLTQLTLEKCGLREKNVFTPVNPDKQLFALRIRQISAASIICIIPALTMEIFFIAPPLIVAFFEMSKPHSKLLERSPQAASLIVIASVSGVLSRFLLTEKLNLPLAVPAAVSCTVILIAVCRMKLYFPPCGAIATLPFIIPEEALLIFPFEIAAGTLFFIAAAFALSKERRIILRVKKILRPQN
ncbi:MAG: hypothetical protein IKW96_12935 [Ruminococcus sp.]|uniref:hypothetical protein n=1 Tax=Ruminococcus sp. TaxID=41978 RepID=UPI0025FE3613|nr:hypothetical protein [Ruminococcus sp.]MBR5684156.1 hypothetical protein [Ruminococcus sp.]